MSKVNNQFDVQHSHLARLLVLIIVLTILILVGTGWGLYRHFQSELEERISSINTERSKGELYRFDEILAMSSRAYVLSGDPKWKERYEEFVPKFQATFDRMVDLADDTGLRYKDQIDQTNDQLIAMEHEAMRMADEGKKLESKGILFSESYEEMRTTLRGLVLQLAKPSKSGVLLERFKEKVLYLDEVLTMSAFMAAYTNDQKWEARYWGYYAELEEALHEIQYLAPDAHAVYATQMIGDAVAELLVMEKAIFDHVRGDDLQAAQKILESSEYKKQKDLYYQGTVRFSDSIGEYIQGFIKKERWDAIKHIVIIGIITILLAIIWFFIWHMLHRWQEVMIFKNLELSDMNRTLDEKVKQRTEEVEKQKVDLELANKDLRKNEEALRAMYKDIKTIHENYKQTQSQLIQSEKLASIGQLAAGVAHEINNPIGFISSNIQSMGQYVSGLRRLIAKSSELKRAIGDDAPEDLKALKKDLESLEEELNLQFIADDMVDLIKESGNGIERIKRIVSDLKTFARKDTDESSLINVQNVLDEVLNILWSELKYTCEIVKAYGAVPLVKVNPQKLSQVFMNLLINAKQAIKTKGKITIRTYHDSEYVAIDITDSGAGIPPEIITQIFNPFFTTKPVGLGTGLGLPISMDIMKSFNGDIKVESKLGEGTTFTVVLPIKH